MFSPDPLQTPFQVTKSTLKNSVLEKLITFLSGSFFYPTDQLSHERGLCNMTLFH